jgi:cobyrinic acid a,c-diamide synthase
LRGGGGKTLISLGIAAAWRRQGLVVAPFKKGPDYIDSAWLSIAADASCRNLDPFLMAPQTILSSFATSAAGADVAIIEGNRGLYDGVDAQGTYSSAELSRLLKTPVILVVDCTKVTRTVAALVLGCRRLDPEVRLAGVILNRIAGSRHESIVRGAIEAVCGLPILGAVPRISGPVLPERHLGLVPPDEHERFRCAIREVGEVAKEHLDLEAILRLAREAPAFESAPDRSGSKPKTQMASTAARVRIALFRDAAFQFYYSENLEALQRAGADLVEVSPIRDSRLPAVDALYIGGGFPETLAPSLAENRRFLESVRRAAEHGLPVYAECGGAVYLGRKLRYEEKEYALAGVLPAAFAFAPRPQGHGYTHLETVAANPFYRVGESLRGHEFHYTYMQPTRREDLMFAFRVRRGHGFDGEHDGLCRRNVLACYTHVHALGVEGWAPSLVRAAAAFATGR